MKKSMLLIEQFLQQKTNFQPNHKLVCALSGGQDSTLLFLSLIFFQKQDNFLLESVYCHHFLQFKNFYCFWQVIRLNFILRTPISLIVTNFPVPKENMARWWRKQSFERIIQFSSNSKLILGHTASDKLETCFHRLVRSSGSQGLTSFISTTSCSNFSILIYFPTNLFTKETKKFRFFRKTTNCFEHKKIRKNLKHLDLFRFAKTKNQNFARKYQFRSTNNLPKLRYDSLNFFRHRNYESFDLWTDWSKNEKQIKVKFFLLVDFGYSYYSSDVQFVFSAFRPLLVLHRNDVLNICKFFELPIVNDSTNKLVKIYRNQIRHQTFPLVRYFYSKKFDFLILRCLNILEKEQEYIYTVSENLTKIFLKQLKFDVFSCFHETIHVDEEKTNRCNNQCVEVSKENEFKIRKLFKTLKTSLQSIYIRQIFLCYTNIHLNYLQVEILRLLISQ